MPRSDGSVERPCAAKHPRLSACSSGNSSNQPIYDPSVAPGTRGPRLGISRTRCPPSCRGVSGQQPTPIFRPERASQQGILWLRRSFWPCLWPPDVQLRPHRESSSVPASDRRSAPVLARTWHVRCRTSRTGCQPSLVTVQSRTVKKLILAAPAALALTACGVATTAAPSHTAALIAARQPLSCRAHMSNTRPGDNTTTVVYVHTQASVKVFTVAFYKTVRRAYFVRAGSDGQARVPYYVSRATPGRKVQVAVTVVRRHSANTCSTSFTPRGLASTSPSPSPSRSSPTPTPSPSHSSAAPSPSSSAGCYPRTSAGNCYEPGEYCPDADHGMHGVAGDGEAIVCEDNNGWRWEPA